MAAKKPATTTKKAAKKTVVPKTSTKKVTKAVTPKKVVKKAVQPKQTAAQKKAAEKAAKAAATKKAAADKAKKAAAAKQTAALKATATKQTAAKKKADDKAAYAKMTPEQKKKYDFDNATPLQREILKNKDNNRLENEAYNNSKEKLNSDKWANGTIDDLSEMGFDYSQAYADKQAEAEGRAKLDGIASGERDNKSANESTLRQIEQGVVNANNSLDHSFFQQMMAQGQSAADSGMNAGIQGDQNLRLGMNKQAQLASVYGQAQEGRLSESSRYNNQLMSFSDQKKTAAVEQLARASSIYQDGREKGFSNLLAQRDSAKGYADTAYAQSQDRVAQNNLNTDRGIDKINSEANLTGMYGGKKTAEQVQRDTDNKLNQNRFAYDVKSGDRNYKLSTDQFAYDKKSGDRDFGLQKDQFAYQKKAGDRSFGLEKDQFNYSVKDGDRNFNYKVKDGDRNFNLEQQKFGFQKSQASSGGGGGGGGGGSKGTKGTKGTKKTNKPGAVAGKPKTPAKGTPGGNFAAAKKKSSLTPAESYYAKEQKKIDKKTPIVRKYKPKPTPIAKNKNLTHWEKMKKIGG